ncbi:MAG: hypothetical protein EOO73_35365 [Myxococcales bacterium]|nr:MAG: hypothetical protein EOO73_35365 [Myxococcales bacterium]
MARRCEVCESLSPEAPPVRRLQRFLIEGRVLALCAEHAHAFREQRPETLGLASQLFVEPDGRRTLLQRRAPLDRRQFPMRPEGRRRTSGRRATDTE